MKLKWRQRSRKSERGFIFCNKPKMSIWHLSREGEGKKERKNETKRERRKRERKKGRKKYERRMKKEENRGEKDRKEWRVGTENVIFYFLFKERKQIEKKGKRKESRVILCMYVEEKERKM